MVEHLQDARRSALRAEIGCGERGGRGCAVAQQRRFGIVVEAQADGHARAVGPRFGRKFAAHARQIHGLPKLFVGPLRAGLVAAPCCAAALIARAAATKTLMDGSISRLGVRSYAGLDFEYPCSNWSLL